MKFDPELNPDEIFLDSRNLPDFNTAQFEGRLERPIGRHTNHLLVATFLLVSALYLFRAFNLQVVRGAEFAERSTNNTLRQITILAERGLITDRNGVELAWNDPNRVYRPGEATAHILGYISHPETEWVGQSGVEKLYHNWLSGVNGQKIEEVDVRGDIRSDYLYQAPEKGSDLALSLDVRLQEKLFELIKQTAGERGFRGGAGVIMDVDSGEIVAMASYPAYDPNIMSAGKNREKIKEYLASKSTPFLNRAAAGLYAPGSTIKPIMALAALNEGIIRPETEILSTGALTLPNPYNPSQPSVFRDWKAHGLVDARHALAFSSDVYFYEIGGGYQSQPGLGIEKINRYAKLFGLASPTHFPLEGADPGTIPNPAWKEKLFGEPWRVGNTYHTVIGQYGFQITPLQLARAIGAIATGGKLVAPTIVKNGQGQTVNTAEKLPIAPEHFAVVREGMRLAVTEGTASGLNIREAEIAAKTGTAEVGSAKQETNAWITGFFPYQAPRYSFALVMERGPSGNLIGGVYIMRQFLDWLKIEAPEYLQLPELPN